MSIVQRVALVFGIVFVLVGIVGFVTSGMSMEADPEMAPMIIGLFPVNLLHNVVHLAFGAWGLLASRKRGAAITYARFGGIAYIALAALGFVTPDLFGLVPIGGNDIWLHTILGVALAVMGFTARPENVPAMA